MMTKANTAFFGTWCPTVTPFDAEGRISLPALRGHLNRITHSGINGILLMGSIGEFISLNLDERLLLLREARSMSALPMIVNISGGNMAEMQLLAMQAEVYGYQAVMVLPPYYFQQTTEQLLAYYRELGQRLPGKWLAYNFPARCGCSLDAGLVRQLAEEFPNFVGLKDTVDGLSHTRAVIQSVKAIRPDFAVFSGFDEYLIPNLMSGGAGVISGLNNICPELFVRAIQAWRAGEMAELNQIQQELGHLSAIYTIGNDFVTTIKTALARKFGDSGSPSRNFAGALTPQQCSQLDALFASHKGQ